MVSSISQGAGGGMLDLIGMTQNNMSLLQSQRESRRVNAGGIVCETTVDPKYMLGALASRQSMGMISNITEKTTLAAAEAALEDNKKYIEEKAQEALAPDTEGTITDQLLEESAKNDETQIETTDSGRDASSELAVSSATEHLPEATSTTGNSTATDAVRQSVDITV